MKHIAIYCGSSNGASSIYRDEARKLGNILAEQGLNLVYGGASVGLMGAVADGVLEAGGHATGILPKFLENREIAHTKLTELILVDTMHERKQRITDLADGFIALPGGPGTIEEFFEVFTWGQLALHQKPCGLLNINHYFDPLLAFMSHMFQEQFIHEKYRPMILLESDAQVLLEKFRHYQAPSVKTYQ